MDRVRRHVDIAVLGLHIENDKVVDVFHVLADLGFGELACSAAEDKIAGCADGDLIGDVAGKLELAVRPSYFDLGYVSFSTKRWAR